jgi:hypothetical protein
MTDFRNEEYESEITMYDIINIYCQMFSWMLFFDIPSYHNY